jgi:hypothetical protein
VLCGRHNQEVAPLHTDFAWQLQRLFSAAQQPPSAKQRLLANAYVAIPIMHDPVSVVECSAAHCSTALCTSRWHGRLSAVTAVLAYVMLCYLSYIGLKLARNQTGQAPSPGRLGAVQRLAVLGVLSLACFVPACVMRVWLVALWLALLAAPSLRYTLC